MLIPVTCYMDKNDLLSDQQMKKLKASDKIIEYDAELNTDFIVSMQAIHIEPINRLKIFKKDPLPAVLVKMSNNDKFFVKAKSIAELKLKAAIKSGAEM